MCPFPGATRVWALPFLTALAPTALAPTALAPSERSAQERDRRHKSIATWARQLIRRVHRWLPDRPLVLVGDRGSAALDLRALRAAVRPVATFSTRLRLDAHLCATPPPRTPHQIGRPRLVGKRLPTLEHWRDDPATEWTSLTVPRWYSQTERSVAIGSQTAVWYHTGLPPVPIRWVRIRDPHGKVATQALLCTDREATPLPIRSWFVLRAQMEGTFPAGPCPPGRRDPTPVVPARHRPPHARPARALLLRHAARP